MNVRFFVLHVKGVREIAVFIRSYEYSDRTLKKWRFYL
jgi:hypothetical protein